MSDSDDIRRRLQEAYETHYDDEINDLAAYHNAATSYLATLDTFAPGELPDDLDPDTKRQLESAKTQLAKALTGIEQTAQERIDNGE